MNDDPDSAYSNLRTVVQKHGLAGLVIVRQRVAEFSLS